MRLRNQYKGMIFLMIIIGIAAALFVTFYMYMRDDIIGDKLKTNPVMTTLIVINDEDGKFLFAELFAFSPKLVGSYSAVLNEGRALDGTGQGFLYTIPENTGDTWRSINRTDGIDTVYNTRGIEALKNDLENFFTRGMVKIDFTMELSLDDFERLADVLGGFTVFIPAPIDERGENGEVWLFPSGTVKLLGSKARAFMTYKLPDEDDDAVRNRRKQIVFGFLSALRENRSIVISKKNIREFSSYIKTNLKPKYLLELLEIMTTVDYQSVTQHEVEGTVTNVQIVINSNRDEGAEEYRELLFPYRDGEYMTRVFNMLINTISPHSQNRLIYTVEVRNGTGMQGLAARTNARLKEAGIGVLNARNADRDDYEETHIIIVDGDRKDAEHLADFLNCSRDNIFDYDSLPPDGDKPPADFILVLGSDFGGYSVNRPRR